MSPKPNKSLKLVQCRVSDSRLSVNRVENDSWRLNELLHFAANNSVYRAPFHNVIAEQAVFQGNSTAFVLLPSIQSCERAARADPVGPPTLIVARHNNFVLLPYWLKYAAKKAVGVFGHLPLGVDPSLRLLPHPHTIFWLRLFDVRGYQVLAHD